MSAKISLISLNDNSVDRLTFISRKYAGNDDSYGIYKFFTVE